jgi:hypothetical protein
MPLVVMNGCVQNTENQSTTSRTTLDRALIWEVSAECNRIQRSRAELTVRFCRGHPVASVVVFRQLVRQAAS